MWLPRVPENFLKEAQDALKLPEGTIEFRYGSNDLFAANSARGIVMQVVSGQNLLRLERDPNFNLHFLHSSLGTGTRVATVSLNSLKGSSALGITLIWSLDGIGLRVSDADDPKKSASQLGKASERKFQVGDDGAIYEIGGEGMEIMEQRISSKGRTILQPTALESWTNTIKAIEILLGGTSTQGYIFENVVTNMAVIMLTTGFETYCRKRFLELELEGINADYDSLVRKFLSNREREDSQLRAFEAEAAGEHVSPVHKLVKDRRIDFGNWDNCKMAYNKGYGIKFGEDIEVPSTHLEEIQRLIDHRDRVVHVSPLLSKVSEDDVPVEGIIFANRQYAEKAVKVASEFVQALHQTTLRLRK